MLLGVYTRTNGRWRVPSSVKVYASTPPLQGSANDSVNSPTYCAASSFCIWYNRTLVYRVAPSAVGTPVGRVGAIATVFIVARCWSWTGDDGMLDMMHTHRLWFL